VREVTGGDLARLEAGEDRFERRLGGRLAWDAETRRQYIEHECERILESCRRKPQEHPRDMYYRYWGDNPFEFTQLDPLSTFAVDVDTASYTLARNYLNKGMIPPKAQVRTEEFVNYFKPEVQAPAETTFAVHTELAPSRFGGGDANKWMLSVNVRGRDVAETERKPLRLTFVVDTSGSMKKENRMELVKHSLRLLLTKLDANDSIALVAFSQEARLILPMTSAGQKGVIESAIHPLAPDGGTNAEAGLKMGYEVALAGHHALATNRVVLLSDGVANIGQVDQDRINQDVTHHRSKGIYLNTVGVGMGNHNDVFLEQLANKGDGLCDYFDTPDEARRALVDNFTGQFEPIARDVKLQVEFDPAQVARYRLLGYENRAIADADFRNDAVDAGEVNAGHQVVALYELERMPGATADGPLATVRLRWKLPYEDASATDEAGADEATEASYLVSAARGTSFEGASFGYRRSVVVAQFAELLRRSRHARDDSLEDLIGEAQILRNQRPRDPDLMELVALLQQSRTVILNSIPACDELCRTIDEIRLKNLQVAQIQLLERDNVLVDKLQKQNIQLELTIRELLELRLQQQGR
jgi:Ca-activated chloride channel family protein